MLVKFFATYRYITKCPSIDISAPDTVLDLLHELVRLYGDEMGDKVLAAGGAELGQDAIVLVNGRHIEHLDGVHTKLAGDDVVAVFPLVAGG